MAGKLSWELDLKGGETAAQKVRDLTKAIATLKNEASGTKGAEIFQAIGGNFSKTFLAKNPHLVAEFGDAGKKSGEAFKKAFNYAAFLNQTMGIGAGERGRNEDFWKKVLPPIKADKTIQTFINESLGIGFNNVKSRNEDFWKNVIPHAGRSEAISDLARRGGSQMMIDMQAAIAQGDFNLNNYKGKAPPIIKAGGGSKGIAGLLDSFGGGGSFGAAFTALKGAFWELAPIIYGVRRLFMMLDEAIKPFLRAIQEGSKLYTDAAKLGKTPGQTAQLDFIAKSLGISTQQAQQMALYAEFNRSQTSGTAIRQGTSRARGGVVEFGGNALGAGSRIQLIGEEQKLLNLKKEEVQLEAISLYNSAIQGNNARQLYETQVQLNWLVMNFKTIWNEIATIAGGVFKNDLMAINLILEAFVEQLNEVVTVMKLLGIISPGGTNFKQSAVANNTLNPNSFQRMGFVMNGGFGAVKSPEQSAAKTAENTTKMVGLLAGIYSKITGGTNAGMHNDTVQQSYSAFSNSPYNFP